MVIRSLKLENLGDHNVSVRVCDRTDNVPMERLFRSIKTEWVPETGYMTMIEASKDISDYLMDYDNWQQPHSHNDGVLPVKAEK